MQYTEIMVRYGELSTKGKNRRNFIDRLGFNVRQAMHDFPKLVVKAHRDRMHIQLNGEDSTKVMERLKQVFGIQNFSPSIRVARDVEEVKKVATQMVAEQFHEGMTCKIMSGSFILTLIPGTVFKMWPPNISFNSLVSCWKL